MEEIAPPLCVHGLTADADAAADAAAERELAALLHEFRTTFGLPLDASPAVATPSPVPLSPASPASPAPAPMPPSLTPSPLAGSDTQRLLLAGAIGALCGGPVGALIGMSATVPLLAVLGYGVGGAAVGGVAGVASQYFA